VSPRDIATAALAGLAALVSLTLLVQLGHRANVAADTVTAVRRDGREIDVLLDRAANAGVLGAGWDRPVLNQGARSIAQTAYLALPTSTAAGDVELTLVVAGETPPAHDRPVALAVGSVPIGTFRPRAGAEETFRLRVPAAARSQSYQIIVAFDLTGGHAGPTPPPLRVLKARTRVAPPV
jgi:hypothetical protein